MSDQCWIGPSDEGSRIVCPVTQGNEGDCWLVGVRIWAGDEFIWRSQAWLAEIEGKEPEAALHPPEPSGAETDRRVIAIRFLCNAGCLFDVAFGHASAPCSVHGPVVVHEGR